MNYLMISTVLLAFTFTCAGCEWIPPEPKPRAGGSPALTEPVNWNTDYVEGRAYEILQPVVLVRYQTRTDTNYKILGLGHHDNTRFGAPRSIEEYESKGPKAWPKTRAILPPGTRIRYVETRVYHGGPTMGSWGVPVGQLVADEFSDVGLIEMSDLSNSSNPRNSGYPAESMDPEYLKPVLQE